MVGWKKGKSVNNLGGCFKSDIKSVACILFLAPTWRWITLYRAPSKIRWISYTGFISWLSTSWMVLFMSTTHQELWEILSCSTLYILELNMIISHDMHYLANVCNPWKQPPITSIETPGDHSKLVNPIRCLKCRLHKFSWQTFCCMKIYLFAFDIKPPISLFQAKPAMTPRVGQVIPWW